MTVDIQTDKQSKATFLPENSYLGYRQLNQVYQNLTKALACYGCGDTCPSPAACIGTFSTGDKLLIILETIQTVIIPLVKSRNIQKSELRYQKMTVRQIARFTGHIKTLTGATIQIENLSPFDTTSSLKVYIQIKWGIPTSEQVLIYGGTTLLDSWTLAERYIDGAATITLVVRK